MTTQDSCIFHNVSVADYSWFSLSSSVVEVMKQMDGNGAPQQTRSRVPSNAPRQSPEQTTRPQCSGSLTTTMAMTANDSNNGKTIA